jgi:methanogenic corrinoid protein MtbC1
MNIQAIAQRTGVPAATLRKWEQRYGVLQPERTPGAHRRYSERDVLRVEWLKARLDEGYRIGEAARLLGGAVHSPPGGPEELVDDLLAASIDPAPDRLGQILDQAFASLSPEATIGLVISPALARIGDLWSAGQATVAEEHQLTEVVRGKLHSFLEDGASGPRGRAVLACTPGERHECGLLALAVLLQADGWQVVYLGQDTPLPTAFELADSLRADVLALSATMADSAAHAEPELERLESRYPAIRILRGGPAWSDERAQDVVARLREGAPA